MVVVWCCSGGFVVWSLLTTMSRGGMLSNVER
jgi:hypothetical protein